MYQRIRLGYFPHGKRKALTMSFDDGRDSDRRAVEILNKYGLKGTFHLNAGKLDRPKYLSKAELARGDAGQKRAAATLAKTASANRGE
jgi:peptidoglycan/xylan/chitin deacetylase (PgdA/CDA1 family)